jgi:hypothetical protein
MERSAVRSVVLPPSKAKISQELKPADTSDGVRVVKDEKST